MSYDRYKMDTTQIRPASAADRVYTYVKGEVLARRFGPHELLSEGQLAQAVGVSRTPVREALLRLESEGLLRLLPKRGALVLPVTADELADVIEARRLVESHAVHKVIASGQVGELDLELGRQLAAMRDAALRRDTAAYVAADRAFHAEIVSAAGNEIIATLYRSLRERQLRMGTVNLLDETGAADPARMRDTLREHEQIRTAIASKQLRAAEAAVTGHLDHAARLLARNR